MSAIEHVFHEKGWGSFFDVMHHGKEHRFCIGVEALSAPGLSARTKRTYPETFEANRSLLLDVAVLLIESGRLETRVDVGGTEILASHIDEVVQTRYPKA